MGTIVSCRDGISIREESVARLRLGDAARGDGDGAAAQALEPHETRVVAPREPGSIRGPRDGSLGVQPPDAPHGRVPRRERAVYFERRRDVRVGGQRGRGDETEAPRASVRGRRDAHGVDARASFFL